MMPRTRDPATWNWNFRITITWARSPDPPRCPAGQGRRPPRVCTPTIGIYLTRQVAWGQYPLPRSRIIQARTSVQTWFSIADGTRALWRCLGAQISNTRHHIPCFRKLNHWNSKCLGHSVGERSPRSCPFIGFYQ